MMTMKIQFLVLHLVVGLTITQLAECFMDDDIDMSGLALFTAAKDGDISTVRTELRKGISPDWRMSLGEDSLGLTSLMPVLEMATKMTPLMAAAEFGHIDICKLLIKKKANVNLPGPKGMTALSMAAGFNHPDIAKLLLQNGADPTQKDELGKTSPDYARVKGYHHLANTIEDYIRAKEHEDIVTRGLALFTAAKEGDITVVRAELAKGIDPDWRMDLDLGKDDDGGIGAIFQMGNKLTPLMVATEFGHLDVVKLLINKKANINLTGPNGMTALSLAAGFNQPDIAELLLQKGADKLQQDDLGKTAADYARLKGHDQLANTIEGFSKEEYDQHTNDLEIITKNMEEGKNQQEEDRDTSDSSVSKNLVHSVLICKLFFLLFLF